MTEAMKACFDIDCCVNHEKRLFIKPERECRIYLTKCPADIMIVGPSLKVDPDLYVIYMIRDPRDIICSKHERDPDRYWASLRYWKTYTMYGRRLSGHPRFIEVRYEDFVSNPDAVQDRLADRIPCLKKRAPFSRYHEVARPSTSSETALRGVRPIRAVSVRKWKGHRERVAGQLALHGSLTEDLIAYGYEKDDSWMSDLEGVQPDMSPSHWPEFMTERDVRKLKRGRYREALKRILERFGIRRMWLKKLKEQVLLRA